MLEPWRSRYLQAIGVDVYVPRYTLPAAAPSCIPEWDAEIVVAAPAIQELVMDATHPVTHSKKVSQPIVDVTGLSAGASRPAQNEIEPVARTSSANAPRIRLLAALSDSGILIIDDLPAQQARRGELQRLYTQLLFAIQRNDVQIKLEAFEWPLANLRNRQVDLDEIAARETFAAFLNKKIQSAGVRSILLLGSDARRWVDESQRQQLNADTAVTWGLSVSGQHVLAEPLLKRRWWQELRHVGLPH